MLTRWNFSDALADAVRSKKSVLCCGLDPQLKYMPPHLIADAVKRFGKTLEAMGWLFFEFNRQVIDAVCDLVVCVKPQMAFYEAYGVEGIRAFEDTVEYARKKRLLVIGDLKRGDGGDTADAYAQGHLGEVPFFGWNDPCDTGDRSIVSPAYVDAMTIHGYIGEDCVCRFVKAAKQYGRGVFVVTKTSFKPNSAVEQLVTAGALERRVWQELAQMVNQWGEGTEGVCGLRNVGVVMGATYPEDAPAMRKILPNSWFLIPGHGKQGGGADGAIAGIREDGLGGVVNSSRGLTFPFIDKDGKLVCEPEKCFEMVRQEAIRSRDELVQAQKRAGKWPF